jgi:hypothetical protein
MKTMAQNNTEPDFREQHPFNEETQKFQAHCNECGSYIEDTATEPPVDYLCESCEFGEAPDYLP